MTTTFRNAAGSDFDDLFEPETNGNGIGDGFYRRSDGSALRFAARNLGNKIPDVAYTSSLGYGDVTNQWAGRGTVAYLLNPPSFNGLSYSAPAEAVTWGDRLLCQIFLNLYSDGTWNVIHTSSNYKTDEVSKYGQYGVDNYSGGRVLGSGYWASNPNAGIGSAYQAEVGQVSASWGWVDYPSFGGQARNKYPGSWKGPSTLQQNNAYGNGVTNMGGVVNIGLVLQAQGTDGNSKYKDRNSGLSWFNSTTFSVTIRSLFNGNLAANGQIYFENEIRWGPTNWPTPLGGSGGGGGGGGGCVVEESFMYDGDIAANYDVGRALWVTDPYRYDGRSNTCVGEVLQAERSLQPCFLIRTEHGAELECSSTAPIPTRDGGFVLAPNLAGQHVPYADREMLDASDVPYYWSQVVEARFIGYRWVRKLFVKDRCFWASKDGKKFILHHNLKMIE